MPTNADFLRGSKNNKKNIAKKMKGAKPLPPRPQDLHQSPNYFKN